MCERQGAEQLGGERGGAQAASRASALLVRALLGLFWRLGVSKQLPGLGASTEPSWLHGSVSQQS